LQSTPAGVSITQPGYLAFLAWQGADVANYAHILARNPVSLGLSYACGLEPTDGAAVAPLALDAGSVEWVIAFPEADDGTMLAGGSPACTFSSSAPELLSVQGRGVIGVVTPLAGATVTLSARCGALAGAVAVQIAGPPPGAGSDASDESEEAPRDASVDAATAPDAAAPDGNEGDAPSDVNQGDAPSEGNQGDAP
jgi:hypothetical protein